MFRKIFHLFAIAALVAGSLSPALAGRRRSGTGSRSHTRASKTRPARPGKRALAQARRLFKKASRAYGSGKYAEAAQLFLQIHGLVGDPALLYNAADAYDKAGMKAKAIENYEAYLRAKPDASDRKTVEARIATLKQPPPAGRDDSHPAGSGPQDSSAEAARPNNQPRQATTPGTARPTEPAGANGAAATTGATARAAREVAGEAPVEERTSPVRKKKHRDHLGTAAWALVGTTAVLLTAAGVFALKMEDAEDQMKRLAIMVDPYTETRLAYEGSYKSDFERYDRQGKLYEKLTWGFAAAAGVTAVTAVVLFSVRAVRSKRERQKVSVLPVMGNKTGGLVLQTEF